LRGVYPGVARRAFRGGWPGPTKGGGGGDGGLCRPLGGAGGLLTGKEDSKTKNQTIPFPTGGFDRAGRGPPKKKNFRGVGASGGGEGKLPDGFPHHGQISP